MGWLSGWSKRQPIVLTGGSSGSQVDFQLLFSIAYDSDMLADFSDLRFTKEDGETLIDAWLEDKTDDTSADVWVEFPSTPANTAEQIYYMYYRKADALSDWDGDATFLQYHGAASAAFHDANVLPSSSVIFGAKVRRTSDSEYLLWGIGEDDDLDNTSQDACCVMMYSSGAKRYLKSRNDGSQTLAQEENTIVLNQWYRAKMIKTVTDLQGYFDDDVIGSGVTADLINEPVGLAMTISGGTGEQEWSFARKYAANPPTYEFGSEENAPSGGNPAWYWEMLKRRNN